MSVVVCNSSNKKLIPVGSRVSGLQKKKISPSHFNMQKSLRAHWSKERYLCLTLSLTWIRARHSCEVTCYFVDFYLVEMITSISDCIACRTLTVLRLIQESYSGIFPLKCFWMFNSSKCFWNQHYHHTGSLNELNTFLMHVHSIFRWQSCF